MLIILNCRNYLPLLQQVLMELQDQRVPQVLVPQALMAQLDPKV